MTTNYDLSIAFDLRPDTPGQVLETLHYMTRAEDDDYPVDSAPQHQAFECSSWPNMINWQRDHPDGFRFPGDPLASLRRAYRYNLPESQGGAPVYSYTFSFRCEIVDDEFHEYGELLRWLALYSHTEGFVGYFRAGGHLHPHLLYFYGGTFYMAEADRQPVAGYGGGPWPGPPHGNQ